MKITIASELVYLKQLLKKSGYQVYDERDNEPSDIYVYNEIKSSLVNVSVHENINPNGALIIYAKNKTEQTIVYEIENRVYSPLFKY